ncbi:MAG: acyltransferase [Microthrixaceae bacterium]
MAPFDGIRGFGVIGVMLGHALPQGTLSFSAIVDVFFIISGFLITTLLLQEHRQTGGVNVRKFYARRLLRLLPGLWVMLAGTAVIGLVIKATGNLDGRTLGGLAKEIVASFLYVHNIVYPVNNGPWIDHLWTLSIEEQFYLVIGVVALLSIARGRVRAVTVALVALVVVVQGSRLILDPGPFGTAAAAVWLQRPDSLMVGMLAALLSASIPDPLSARARRILSTAGWVGIPVLFFSVWASTGVAARLGLHHPYVPANHAELLAEGLRPHGFYWIQWGNSAADWAAAAITLCAFRVPDWWPNRFLSVRLWVWTGGLLSYALYIWHVPVQELLRALLPASTPKPLWVVLAVTVPFAFAYPSYRFVERRALAWKNRFTVTGDARTAALLGDAAPRTEPT